VKSRIGSFDGRVRPAGVSPGHTSTAASPLQDADRFERFEAGEPARALVSPARQVLGCGARI
jgi:hypothetical protein